ncbi:hypothetical protein D9611_005991 [Ephemerocybe angulata]|uniref:Fungal-type protein kinase domain-containing protein n=1 Tax=Ephemerocybe angulata TaxID=980116 RepID=A0A8H5FLU2_9AGAR|nr:hypothetical protein D9611_005991 [Tulosesus angulatus]
METGERIHDYATINLRFKGYLFDFKTQTQAIAAMRDVLFAYMCLLSEAGIVPGTMAPSSILLGIQDAAERPRGVLVDFDISMSTKHAGRKNRDTLKMYMSAADIASCDPHNHPSPPHDEMDDLESAHYVLSELMFGFKGPRRKLVVAKRRSQILVKWERETYSNAYDSKLAYFSDEDLDTRDVPAYWKTACKTLLCGLHRLLTPVVRKKRRLSKLYCEDDRKALEYLLEGSGALYLSALKLFDKALDELRDTEVV